MWKFTLTSRGLVFLTFVVKRLWKRKARMIWLTRNVFAFLFKYIQIMNMQIVSYVTCTIHKYTHTHISISSLLYLYFQRFCNIQSRIVYNLASSYNAHFIIKMLFERHNRDEKKDEHFSCLFVVPNIRNTITLFLLRNVLNWVARVAINSAKVRCHCYKHSILQGKRCEQVKRTTRR